MCTQDCTVWPGPFEHSKVPPTPEGLLYPIPLNKFKVAMPITEAFSAGTLPLVSVCKLQNFLLQK